MLRPTREKQLNIRSEKLKPGSVYHLAYRNDFINEVNITIDAD